MIDTMLEQVHGHRMPEHVGRDALAPEGWAGFPGRFYMFREQVLDTVAAQVATACAGEQWTGGGTWGLTQPRTQQTGCLLAQWRAAFLASLTVTSDVRANPKHDVLMTKSSELGNSEAGLHGEQEEQVVTTTRPGATIWRGEQRVDLDASKEANELSCVALAGHGQHPLDDSGLAWLLQASVSEERVDGSQAGIPGPGTVAPRFLEMIEECPDQRSVQMLKAE